MKKQTLIWIISLSVILLGFLFLIPTRIYNIAPMIFSFAGAILVGISLYKLIISFITSQETKEKPGCFIFIAVLLGLGMGFVFLINFNSRETQQLKSNGVITKGIVIDGKSMKNRKGAVYSIEIEFETNEKIKLKVKEDIGEKEFSQISIGQQIPIVYSQENPELVAPILTNEAVSKFTEIESKALSLKNLLELCNKDTNTISTELNKLGLWIHNGITQYGEMWKNFANGETIILNDGQITYMRNNQDNLYLLQDEMNKEGFSKMDSDKKPSMNGSSNSIKTISTYESDSFTLILSEISENNENTLNWNKSFIMTLKEK